MNLGCEFTIMIRFMGEVLPSVGGFALVFCRATAYPAHTAPLFFLSHLYVYFRYHPRIAPTKSLRDASVQGCCSDEQDQMEGGCLAVRQSGAGSIRKRASRVAYK